MKDYKFTDISAKDIEAIDGSELKAIFDHSELEIKYREYAENIQSNKIFLGFPSIDEKMNGLRPGEVMTVIAQTNVGKSAFALNVMYAAAQKTDGLIIFFSTELDEFSIFERFAQMHLGLPTSEIERIYNSNDAKRQKELAKVIEIYGNCFFTVKRIYAQEIMRYVNFIANGRNVSLIIVDHLQGLLTTGRSNRVESLEILMMQLKEISLHSKLPILLLSHTARQDMRSSEGLNLYSGKGSGEIENSSQIVFTLETVKECDPGAVDEDTAEKIFSKKAKLLKLTPHKKKRGNYEAINILFDTISLKMTEYDKPPIF